MVPAEKVWATLPGPAEVTVATHVWATRGCSRSVHLAAERQDRRRRDQRPVLLAQDMGRGRHYSGGIEAAAEQRRHPPPADPTPRVGETGLVPTAFASTLACETEENLPRPAARHRREKEPRRFEEQTQGPQQVIQRV